MLRTITVVSKPIPVRKPAHSRATSELLRTTSLHEEYPKHIPILSYMRQPVLYSAAIYFL